MSSKETSRPNWWRLAALLPLFAVAAASAGEPPMLDLVTTGKDPAKIDYATLPVLTGDHALITAGPGNGRDFPAPIADMADLDDPTKWNYRLHSYLAWFDGKFWAMWSHGRIIEDHPSQHIRYSTSPDGLHWSEPRILVGPTEKFGFRYISRGFWVRDGRLLALAGYDEAYGPDGKVHFFGPSLELRAFQWNGGTQSWDPLGRIAKGAINNFPPTQLPNGEWGMIGRGPDYHRDVFMLTGGVDSASDWKRSPIVTDAPASGFRPEEPDWWTLPDGRLLGLFRDNSRSGRFYRAFSSDNGRSWTAPTKTNFPDATSKFFCLRTSRGYYILVSNTNPAGRNPLCLSVSDDGITFTRMARLPIPVKETGGVFDAEHTSGSVQYPHAIEHDGALYVVYSRQKTAIEVIRVALDEVERIGR